MRDITHSSHASLLRDLTILYDQFSEFDAYCAFFCNAVACLSTNREAWLDDASAEGLCLFSQWLKDRSIALKGELEVVRGAVGQKEGL
jgi:hypothetical protein